MWFLVMKFVPKANQSALPPAPKVPEVIVSEISVDRLIDDTLVTLYREVKNLLILSARGKLDPTNARDLRDNLKLLFELKQREKDLLKGLTDDELRAKANQEPANESTES